VTFGFISVGIVIGACSVLVLWGCDEPHVVIADMQTITGLPTWTTNNATPPSPSFLLRVMGGHWPSSTWMTRISTFCSSRRVANL
jgi:hypothetical protein